jgi:hypothetical protein
VGAVLPSTGASLEVAKPRGDVRDQVRSVALVAHQHALTQDGTWQRTITPWKPH